MNLIENDDHGIFIYGAGNFGKKLSKICQKKGLKTLAYIDKNAEKINDSRVKSLENFAQEKSKAKVYIGVLNRSAAYSTIRDDLVLAGVQEKNIVYPWDYYDLLRDELGWQYWLESPDYITRHQNQIMNASELFYDDYSKQLLKRICAFRKGEDLDYSNYVSHEKQYFNELTSAVKTKKNSLYLDIGAYDGDTYREYIDFVTGDVKGILFEPDAGNYCNLIKNIQNLDHCKTMALPCAVSDKNQILSFSNGSGEGSHISDNGGTKVQALALDTFLIKEHVDFIKIDVEGAELSVLKGAHSIIKESRPILAISYYHNPWDIWEIPNYLNEFFGDLYRMYLRQHMRNSFDSVLYLIPK